MNPDKSGKSPDQRGVLSNEEKAKISKEALKIHRECMPLFSLAKKLTEPDVQAIIIDSIGTINRKVLDIHEVRKTRQNGSGKKLEAESLVGELRIKIEEFYKREMDEENRKVLQEILSYSENILVSHIRQIKTKDL